MKEKLFKHLPVISLVVIVLALAALFIPQSFVNFQGSAERSYSGIEAIFNFNWPINSEWGWLKNNIKGRASAAGIIFIILSVFAFLSYAFSKKSNSLKLFGGILNTLDGIILLSMELWMLIVYPQKAAVVLWMPYVFGALLLIIGALGIYGAIIDLKEEKYQVYSKKGYSYLKNK